MFQFQKFDYLHVSYHAQRKILLMWAMNLSWAIFSCVFNPWRRCDLKGKWSRIFNRHISRMLPPLLYTDPANFAVYAQMDDLCALTALHTYLACRTVVINQEIIIVDDHKSTTGKLVQSNRLVRERGRERDERWIMKYILLSRSLAQPILSTRLIFALRNTCPRWKDLLWSVLQNITTNIGVTLFEPALIVHTWKLVSLHRHHSAF